MSTDPLARLRLDLVRLLDGGEAHLSFDDAVRGVTADELGRTRPGASGGGPDRPHTVWRLVEHIRMAQRDLLDYARGEGYEEKTWPDDYWPKDDAPPGADDAAMLRAFAESCDAIRADTGAFRTMIQNPKTDPLAPLPHANNTTLTRNVLVAADHLAYHLGQLVELRKALGTWPKR